MATIINESEANDFGKELSIMHKLALKGRTVGMGNTEWSIIAEGSDRIMAQIAELVRLEIKLQPEDRAAIEKWVNGAAARDLPFL